jgi:hypothetical protein
MHLDLHVDSQEELGAEVDRLVGLGARHVDWTHPDGAAFVVLTDTERDLFCVVNVGNIVAGRLSAEVGRYALLWKPLFLKQMRGDNDSYRGASPGAFEAKNPGPRGTDYRTDRAPRLVAARGANGRLRSWENARLRLSHAASELNRWW